MKTYFLPLLIAMALLAGYGCTKKPDSNQVAEETNDSLIEQMTPVQQEHLAADTKSNAKDVAEFMIAFADAGQTARALSKLAVERAKHPDVKAYARQALKQQHRHETRLAEAAQTYKIVLPKTLSTDSETMVRRLRNEKRGQDFDNVYLRYMVDVTDAVVGKSKNLVDNADSPGIKNLAQTISTQDEKLMQDAEKLKEKVR